MDTLKNNSREKTFSCLYQAGETTHEFKNWRSADWSLLSLFWKHKERKWERSVWFSLMLILFIVLLKKILRCSIQHCFIVSIWIVLNKVLLIGVFFCASSVSQNLCRLGEIQIKIRHHQFFDFLMKSDLFPPWFVKIVVSDH